MKIKEISTGFRHYIKILKPMFNLVELQFILFEFYFFSNIEHQNKVAAGKSSMTQLGKAVIRVFRSIVVPGEGKND